MPELPEVEIIVRGLRKSIVNRKIKSIEVLVNKLFVGSRNNIINSKIISVERLGKTIIIRFVNNYALQIHLKMTGQLIFAYKNQNLKFKIKNLKLPTTKVVGGHPDNKYNQPLPHKYTHIIINFTDYSTLYYNDLRKFGWMKIIQNSKFKIQNDNLKSKIGVDGLTKKLSIIYLTNKFKNRRITIKQAAEQISNDSSLAQIDKAYKSNASFDFKSIKNESISIVPELDSALRLLTPGQISDVFAGKVLDTNSGKKIEALYAFGTVTQKISTGKVISFDDWLTQQRSKYAVTYY